MKDKKFMIQKISKYLEEQASLVMSDKDLSVENRLSQMDIVLNVAKFLADYDKNIEILNKYYYDNNYKRYQKREGENNDDTKQH